MLSDLSSYSSSLTGGATELTKCGGKVANSFSVIGSPAAVRPTNWSPIIKITLNFNFPKFIVCW